MAKWQILKAASWAWKHLNGMVDPMAKNIIDGITDVRQLGALIHCDHKDDDKTNNVLSNGLLMRKEDHEAKAKKKSTVPGRQKGHKYTVRDATDGRVVFCGVVSVVAEEFGVACSTIQGYASNGKAFKTDSGSYAGRQFVIENTSKTVVDLPGEKWVKFPYDDLGKSLPKCGKPVSISNLARVVNAHGVVRDFNKKRLPTVGIAGSQWSVAALVAFCFHRKQSIEVLRKAHPTLTIAEAFRERNIHCCHQLGFDRCDNTAAAVRLGTSQENNEENRKTFWLWPDGRPNECKKYVGVLATAAYFSSRVKGKDKWYDLKRLLNGKRKSSLHGLRGSYTKPLVDELL